ncbi:MAG: rRNA maturation RNase YbeY [Bacteroidetes bacterium]|nr:rRNA maturation RNase YbeY [Bacteroidota bacterium]
MIELNNTYDLEFPKSVEDVYKTGIDAIMNDHKKKYTLITITLLTDEALLEINQNFLNHDYYTDIITFSYSEENEPIEAELFISSEMVASNAKKYNVTYHKELLRVIFHGCLHLCGFNDTTEEERKEMKREENFYVMKFAMKY